jgi:hypothetical protein
MSLILTKSIKVYGFRIPDFEQEMREEFDDAVLPLIASGELK